MSHNFIVFVDISKVQPIFLFPFYLSILLYSLPQNAHIAFAKIVPVTTGLQPYKVALGDVFYYTGWLVWLSQFAHPVWPGDI